MRDISKLDFIHEVVVWHESSPATKPLDFWRDCPTELHGKPVVYLPQTSPMEEMAKYEACAKNTRKESNVCYFQLPQRDATGYLESLWASFLRSPDLLHTAVSASTYYLDQACALPRPACLPSLRTITNPPRATTAACRALIPTPRAACAGDAERHRS